MSYKAIKLLCSTHSVNKALLGCLHATGLYIIFFSYICNVN